MDNDFLNQEGTIVKVADINREMRKSFIDYSMSVIVARALPDVRDGLNRFTDGLSIQCTKTA